VAPFCCAVCYTAHLYRSPTSRLQLAADIQIMYSSSSSQRQALKGSHSLTSTQVPVFIHCALNRSQRHHSSFLFLLQSARAQPSLSRRSGDIPLVIYQQYHDVSCHPYLSTGNPLYRGLNQVWKPNPFFATRSLGCSFRLPLKFCIGRNSSMISKVQTQALQFNLFWNEDKVW
jgi:hypothetical protein